jgi:hypothetical protein
VAAGGLGGWGARRHLPRRPLPRFSACRSRQIMHRTDDLSPRARCALKLRQISRRGPDLARYAWSRGVGGGRWARRGGRGAVGGGGPGFPRHHAHPIFVARRWACSPPAVGRQPALPACRLPAPGPAAPQTAQRQGATGFQGSLVRISACILRQIAHCSDGLSPGAGPAPSLRQIARYAPDLARYADRSAPAFAGDRPSVTPFVARRSSRTPRQCARARAPPPPRSARVFRLNVFEHVVGDLAAGRPRAADHTARAPRSLLEPLAARVMPRPRLSPRRLAPQGPAAQRQPALCLRITAESGGIRHHPPVAVRLRRLLWLTAGTRARWRAAGWASPPAG